MKNPSSPGFWLRLQFDDDLMRITHRCDRNDFANAVDMAGDDMAAEFVAHFKRAFQVEFAPLGPLALCCAILCFARYIDCEPAASCIAALIHNRQAYART